MSANEDTAMSSAQGKTEVPASAASQECGSILDPSKSKATTTSSNTIADLETTEVIAPHATGGHTFVVTTVVTETLTKPERNTCDITSSLSHNLIAVPVPHTSNVISCTNAPAKIDGSQTAVEMQPTTVAVQCDENSNSNSNASSSTAIVPLSTSLPSKLLRFHAKRSAHALRQQIEQTQSLDSQFGSDEGAVGGSEYVNDCADIFDVLTPTAATGSSPQPHSTLIECMEEKLIDVGMGSSIEDSDESEEDDELKPLAVDNHVLHDIDLSSPVSERQLSPQESKTAVLSEANLEKFRRHLHHHNTGVYNQMDNIYLHPNFKYDLDNAGNDVLDGSPPPAIAPANSPVEQKRVHRSFLTMRKPTAAEVEAEKANSVATTDANSEQALVNEIDTLDPSLIPNDELASEITEAVEYYFSNESILKDAFLLKHVRRNKEGFVSLKLVSSFKRVRQLTKEWKVVGYAVRQKSRKIELNEQGTKIRRLDALPNFDETMPSRTIVACDLPMDKLTIETVSDIFSKCGEIALIRILKPGMVIPVDVRQFMNKYPEMQQKECALVEYLESSSARDARNLQGPFQVYEMVAPKKKTGKKAVIQVAAPVARMVENYRYYNDATYERTRGGSFSGVVAHDSDLRFKLKRNNSDFHPKAHAEFHQASYGQHYHHHQALQQQPHHSPTHRGSFGNEHTHPFQPYQPRGSIGHEPNARGAVPAHGSMNFYAFSPRRYSNASTISSTTAALGEVPNTAPMPTNHMGGSNNIVNNNSSNNMNTVGTNTVRRLSNCSDSYSSYSEMSRRASNCSDHVPQRRDSNCSDNCPCARRVSDFGQSGEIYRKTSQSSIGSGVGIGERRFSNGSMQFERTFSNASDLGNNINNINNMNGMNNNTNDSGISRRLSNDFNYDRRQSTETQTGMSYDADGNVGGGGGGYMVFPRRYSNNFNNVSSKLAAYDNAQYINGRRISSDSGYDRRFSFGSEYEGSPRSRTSSFLNNYKNNNDYEGQPRSRTGSFLDGSPRSRSGSLAQRNAENLVRTPIGPDGSKGFGSRARKFGQTVSPVN